LIYVREVKPNDGFVRPSLRLIHVREEKPKSSGCTIDESGG